MAVRAADSYESHRSFQSRDRKGGVLGALEPVTF